MKNIVSVRLVLEAKLSDGSIVEGSTREFPNSIVEDQDACILAEVQAAALDLDGKVYSQQELYLVELINILQKHHFSHKIYSGKPINNTIDLCLERLILNLKFNIKSL